MIFKAFEAVILGAVVGFGLLIFIESTWELFKISKSKSEVKSDSLTTYNKFIYYCRGIFIRKQS